jgi:hypothetical protein
VYSIMSWPESSAAKFFRNCFIVIPRKIIFLLAPGALQGGAGDTYDDRPCNPTGKSPKWGIKGARPPPAFQMVWRSLKVFFSENLSKSACQEAKSLTR